MKQCRKDCSLTNTMIQNKDDESILGASGLKPDNVRPPIS